MPNDRHPDRHIARWLAVLPLLALAAAPAAIQAQLIHFRAPQSGDKVSGYPVDLPISRSERRSFAIPEQCAAAAEALARGAAQWGSQVEKSLWWKVDADCRYHDLITRFAAQPFNDLVSDYDFMNADLTHLPLGTGAPATSPRPGVGGMQYASDLTPVLPLADPTLDAEGMTRGACRVRQGTFRGWVRLTPQGPLCRQDERGPGFRIVSVDYGDVDGDTYQDAVLRVVPLGVRMGRTPVVLALTRKGEEEEFAVVAGGVH
jgi:hypothetical protein